MWAFWQGSQHALEQGSRAVVGEVCGRQHQVRPGQAALGLNELVAEFPVRDQLLAHPRQREGFISAPELTQGVGVQLDDVASIGCRKPPCNAVRSHKMLVRAHIIGNLAAEGPRPIICQRADLGERGGQLLQLLEIRQGVLATL